MWRELRLSWMHATPLSFRRVQRAVWVSLLLSGAASGVSQVPSATQVPVAPIVQQPLAPAANDVPDEQPSTQHVWVPGHWRWQEGAYVWEAGRWEVPPTPFVTWHPPQWEQKPNGFALRDGYWAEPPQNAGMTVSGAAAPAPITTTIPPPPLQREVIPGRPTGAHVWVPGFWGWRDGKHTWESGRWVVPPRKTATWIPARWELRGDRYALVPGEWRDVGVLTPTAPPTVPQQVVPAPAPRPQEIVVVTPPPVARQEIVYARPSPRHMWVPGFWSWYGDRYVWIAGHYALPPRGRQQWVPPRWERRGSNYLFVEGHWR